jgi:hypothetical protein
LKIIKKGEIKLGAKIHPIEVDYGIIQCKNCNKFGHFHKSKDQTETICKLEMPICVHCGKNHNLEDCPNKENRKVAMCSNCKGNHRANDHKCGKTIEKINLIRNRYIC